MLCYVMYVCMYVCMYVYFVRTSIIIFEVLTMNYQVTIFYFYNDPEVLVGIGLNIADVYSFA